MMKHGTTTVEIKSGYGLSEEAEIKMLDAISELADEHFMTIRSTFLGAHAIPPEFQDHRTDYIDLLCERMLPHIAKRKLAQFCDVFCELGYFSLEETQHILEKARSHGLALKLHADEFNSIGATQLAAKLRAASVDHLEHISDDAMEQLRQGTTIAVVLPGVSFFLRNLYAPAENDRRWNPRGHRLRFQSRFVYVVLHANDDDDRLHTDVDDSGRGHHSVNPERRGGNRPLRPGRQYRSRQTC